MSEPREHSAVVLTKAEKRILAHIVAHGPAAAFSSRKLAHQLDLCRNTVLSALRRFNELEFICTVPGSPTRPNVHLVCGSVAPLPQQFATHAAAGGRS